MKEDRRRDKRLRRRLTLPHDGRPFLERWGFVQDRIGGIYLHHIAGPDPGLDLHDHPWWFCSIVLTGGGYTERRISIREALDAAAKGRRARPGLTARRRWSIRVTRLDVAHRIVSVDPGTWTLVLRGPTRREWGFYLPDGWVDWKSYPYETRHPGTAQFR